MGSSEVTSTGELSIPVTVLQRQENYFATTQRWDEEYQRQQQTWICSSPLHIVADEEKRPSWWGKSIVISVTAPDHLLGDPTKQVTAPNKAFSSTAESAATFSAFPSLPLPVAVAIMVDDDDYGSDFPYGRGMVGYPVQTAVPIYRTSSSTLSSVATATTTGPTTALSPPTFTTMTSFPLSPPEFSRTKSPGQLYLEQCQKSQRYRHGYSFGEVDDESSFSSLKPPSRG